jgi:hypothetical protein
MHVPMAATGRVWIVVCAVAVCASARAQDVAPMNTAYEQLPTTWDAEPLPAVEPNPTSGLPSGALPAAPTATPLPPQASPSPASTLTPPMSAPGYVTQTSVVCGDGCVDCGTPCVYSVTSGAYPPHSFWFANAELTILNQSYENGLFALDDNNEFAAPRLTVGWESPRGVGIRTRFWWRDDSFNIVSDLPIPPESEVEFDSSRFDFDVYRRFTFDGSSISVGGGLAVARMGWELEDVRIRDAGAGLNFFVEGRHDLIRTPNSTFGLVGRGRWASLIGEWRNVDAPGRVEGDSTMEIFEAGFGWDYVREYQSCDFFFQHMLEAQTWYSTLVGDVGFFGQSVAIGVRW